MYKKQGDWLGKAGEEIATSPEMVRLPTAKVFCICDAEEEGGSDCTQPRAVDEKLELPGGHHFDGDYLSLAKKMLQTIRNRENAPGA